MGVEACIIAAQGGKVPKQTITPYYIIKIYLRAQLWDLIKLKQLNLNEFLDSKSSCIITIFRVARNPPKFEKTLEISD